MAFYVYKMYLETTRFIYVYLIEFLQNLVCKTMILVLSPAMRKKSCLGPTHKNLDRCDNYITGLHIINILLLLYSSHYIDSLELIYPMNETSNRDHQVTSKEILDVAFEKSKSKFTTPRQTIQDTEELQSYQQTKRKEFEQHINKTD